MRRPLFTPAEVALARRIVSAQDEKRWDELEEATKKPPLTFQEFRNMLDKWSWVPPGGPTPPWWEQAIEWADHQRVFVINFGYMDINLWIDILACEGK